MAKNRNKEYAKRRQERALDKLAAFEEFSKNLLPHLKGMLLEGNKSAGEILEAHKAYAAARLVQIVATEMDSSKALSAVKDLLDRTEGKAVERIEQTHRFDKLDEEQLDALLLSKLREVGAEEIEARALPEPATGDDDV